MAARKATIPPYNAVDVFQAGKYLRFDHLISQFGAEAEVKCTNSSPGITLLLPVPA